MSRVRRLSFAITEEGRRSAAINQAKHLRDTAVGIVDTANLSVNFATLRRVTKRAAFTVILRSLERTKSLPFSLREHMALKELSSYITLAQHNKNTSLTLAHTDLLPISHPNSTREHTLTASALRQSRANWVSDDPRIIDPRAKTILASALISVQGSVKHIYYTTLLASLPQGLVPLEALTAAFGDGNSTAARRARAALQRRDRNGQFAEEGGGGGFKSLVRRQDGLVYTLTGRRLADGKQDGFIQMELSDGRILEVPVWLGEYGDVKAVLPTPDGYSETPISPDSSRLGDVVNEADLVEVDAPNGWDYDEEWSDDKNKIWNDGAFEVSITKDGNGKKKFELYLQAVDKEDYTIATVKSWADVQDRLRNNEIALAEIPAEFDRESKSVDEIIAKVDKSPAKDTPDESPDFDPADDVLKKDEEEEPTAEEIEEKPKEKKKKGNKKANLPVITKNPEGDFVFSYPKGAYKIAPGQTYVPKGGQGEDITDDPVEIAQRFTADELIFALDKGVRPNKNGADGSGYGDLDFSKGPEATPVEAIHNALREQGEDADGLLANIYDDIAGNRDNVDRLVNSRDPNINVKANIPDVSEIFENVTQGKPDVADAPEANVDGEEVEEDWPLPPLLEGLSEEEKQSFLESGDHTPFLPKNAEHVAPEGYYQIGDSPYEGWVTSTEEEPHDVIPVGYSNNPVFLAGALEIEDLLNELRRGLEPSSDAPGYGVITFLDEKDEEQDVNVPVEAIRDALQLQGIDTDAEIEKIYAEGRAGQVAELPDAPVEDAAPTPVDDVVRDGLGVPISPERLKAIKARSVPVEPTPEDDIKAEDLTPEQAVRRTIKKVLTHGDMKGKSLWGQEKDSNKNAFMFGEISDKQIASIRRSMENFPDGQEKQAVLDSLDGKHGDKLNGMMFSKTASSIISALKDWEASKKEDTKAVIPDEAPEEAVKGLPLTGEILNGKVTYSIGEPKQTNDIVYRVLTLTGDTSSLTEAINKRKSRNFIVTGEDGGDLEIKMQRERKRFPAPGNVKEDIYQLISALQREGGVKDAVVPDDRDKQEDTPSDTKEDDTETPGDGGGDGPTPPEEKPPTPEQEEIFTEEVKKDGWKRLDGPGLAWGKGDWVIRLSDGYGGAGILATYKGGSDGYVKRVYGHSYSGMKDRFNEEDGTDNRPEGSDKKRVVDIVVGDEAYIPGMGWRKVIDVQKDSETGEFSVAYEDNNGETIYEWFKGTENLRTRTPKPSKADDKDTPAGPRGPGFVDSERVDTVDEEAPPVGGRRALPAPSVEEVITSRTPRITSARTTDLKPGDVMSEDYFTITKVEEGYSKKRDGELVPASQVSGYYPGGVEQTTKLWADDVVFNVFRDVTPPPTGDLPELSKPNLGDYGKMTKVDDKWVLRDSNAQIEFDQDMKKYVEKLDAQKALWSPGDIKPAVKEFTPEDTLHVVNALGKDLKPNDIAFRRDGESLGEFFVIEEVLPGTVMTPRADKRPAEEKVQIRGYYPGHQSQVKSWKVGTEVEVIRGERLENIPAKGDKPGIDSIEPGTLKGKAYQDKNAEISAARKEASAGYKPSITAADVPKVLVEKPSNWDRGARPGFVGSAVELAKLKDGKAIWEALKEKTVVYFDFETVGKGFDSDNPDAPIQVAASKYEKGIKVDEINLFINPGEGLGDFYYKTDESGNKTLDPDKLLNSDGAIVDDEFLASQPDIAEQLRKLSEFMGPDSILVAHNAEFDTNTFEHWAKKLGVDYKIDGVIDTLELAKSMVPKGNKLGQVADRYGIAKTDEEWHDARTDSEVLPAILEGLLGDMTPDNKEFDTDSRMATFNYKRSSYNEKMEAWKKQQAELASSEVIKKVMSGETATMDDILSSVKATPTFGPDGSTDSAEPYQFESIYGGKISNEWVEDNENTFAVGDGTAMVGDIQVGDFVPALNGGYHEVVLVRPDPDSDWGVVVVRRIVETGELYSERVTEKKSPGEGWDLRKTLIGTLRRRNELGGKTKADASRLASKPIVIAPENKKSEKVSIPEGKGNVTVQDTVTLVSDAIKSITSVDNSNPDIETAVKSLPIAEKTKAAVLSERGDSSPNHMSADGAALRVSDRVMGTKTRRTGEVRGIIPEYGSRGYKNYVRVRFDDTQKSENISAGSLQIINSDEGAIGFVDGRRKSTGPVNPSDAPIPEETLSSLLSGEVPADVPAVEIPEEPVIQDPEEKARAWKQKEEERMAYALEKNYRQVSPGALSNLTAAVGEAATFDTGHKISFTAFMPNLSTGEPLERAFTFSKPSKSDLRNKADYLEPEDILAKTGPNNVSAIIKSDGKIIYFDNPAAPNWTFSVVSPDLMSALESRNDLGIPMGKSPNIQKMGMMSVDDEIMGASGSPDDATPNDDFVESVPDTSSKGIRPTKQQQAVIDAVVAGKNVIVQALAGTGKTSTLKMAAKAIAEKFPKKRILYIAFNKAVAAELNADPDRPANMIARTNTQVAWHHSPTWMQKRSFDKTSIFTPMEVVDHLKIVSIPVKEIKKDGTVMEVNLSSREVAIAVRQAVLSFAQSADEKAMEKHFTDNFVEVPQEMVDYANLWWKDISSPTGKLQMNQSFPEKYVQLNGIDVRKFPEDTTTNPLTAIPASDIIFFDEAQDINDVAADWVRKQKVQKVFVGDGNQSIYGFRGAKDQLDTLEGAEKLQITESFRFGPTIAAQANKFLTVSGKTEKVIGAGKTEGVIVEGMEYPDAVLVRTNGGGFKAMMEYLELGKIVGISQSTKTRLEEVIDTTSWLMGGKKGSKPAKYNAEIGMYDSWEELSTAVREGRGRPVKALYELITFNGIQSIRDILDRVVVEREETAESKIALAKYRPLTIDRIRDGYTDKLSKDVTYGIDGDDVVITGFFKFNNDKLKEAGFIARKNKDGTWAPDRRINIEDNQRKLDKLNQLKKILEGVIEPVKADVVVTTAHQAKGLQWNKVRIYEDFWGPRLNKDTAELDMPAPEELRLAYVALTRAQKELDMGPLVWVNDYTSEEDEQAPEMSRFIQGMSNIETDPIPVTPEELDGELVETAKNLDPATKRVTDAIIAALEAGTAPWKKPWTGGGFMPTSIATGKMYEGSNVLVLWAAQEINGWTDNRWLTYRQSEKLGGNIKRGEKATSIIHWTPRFKDKVQPDGSTEKVFVYTPPKIISVFNVEQAENINLPPIVKGEPVSVSQGEQMLLDAYKDRPEIFHKSQDRAYYLPSTDTIHLPLREQFTDEQSMFETIAHELAHSTGHINRVGRKDLLDNYGNHIESRSEEELIAEISVALVAARLGIEMDVGNVAAYAKSWLSHIKNDPTMLIKAAKQAQKAVDHMLGKQEEPAAVDVDGNPVDTADTNTPDVAPTVEAPTPTQETDATPEVTSKGYVRSKIKATDLEVGDRLNITGKTRVSTPPKVMSDGSLVVGTRTIGSKGGGIASFEKDQEINVWRKPESSPTTEDNVGSDGRTGEEISNDPTSTPTPTPRPNVGEQGKTGEEIASGDKTPKNIKPGVTVSTHTIDGTSYPLWDDIDYGSSPPSDPAIETASGRTFRAVMSGQEVLTDKYVIGSYVSEIFKKYGFGDRLFDFNIDKADAYFEDHPELSHIEAGVSFADTDLLPDGHPLKDKILPQLMIRKRGTTKVALLHEIAHMMEGNWIGGPNADGGHNSVWYATWVTLLRSEGFYMQANILEKNAGKLEEGDTGVLRT